jgi:hypothetical protein
MILSSAVRTSARSASLVTSAGSASTRSGTATGAAVGKILSSAVRTSARSASLITSAGSTLIR